MKKQKTDKSEKTEKNKSRKFRETIRKSKANLMKSPKKSRKKILIIPQEQP